MADDSMMFDCAFALNDGNVTVVADSSEHGVERGEHGGDHHKQDGSDSGVELNGGDPAAMLDTPLGAVPPNLDYDGTSEGGSESSSVLSSSTPCRKKMSGSTSSTSSCTTPSRPHQGPHPRSRSVAATTPSTLTSRMPSAPVPAPRDRSSSTRGSSCSRARQCGGSVPDSLAAPASRTAARAQRTSSASSAGANLMTSSMTGSLTGASNVRGRGACRTPSAPRPAPRGAPSASPSTGMGTSVTTSMTASADDGRWPFTAHHRPTTLGRTRASSVATERDRRVQGMTSSSSKTSVNSTNSTSTPSPTVESVSEKFSTLPRRRRRRSVENIASSSQQPSRKAKVTLYHETSVQTALTSQDLDDVLGGKACHLRPIDAKEQSHVGIQVEREREDFATQMLDRRLKAIVDMLGFEHSGTLRSSNASISSTVPSPPKDVDHTAWIKTLELLEQRASTVKMRDLHQRNEIGRLRYEMEHTERLRKHLQTQQEETEAETLELQEFMQAEKSMLAESLKESEKEVAAQKKIAEILKEDLERQREECQHLVRISEQRRQEILTLEARIAGMELRSRESLLQQGAAVSGASVALSALNSRLDDLAARLEASSAKEALATLITEAEAVTTRTKEACRPLSVHLENGFQTLDNETEPYLEEEGGGHRDSNSTENTESASLVNSESIQNLSAAILFRHLQEEAISSEPNVTNDDVPGHLVDQVLDVDSLVTRVLRAISDTVHAKQLPLDNEEEGPSQTCNGTIHKKMESKVLHKIEDQVESTKQNHIPLLNVPSDGTCSDSNSLAVNGIGLSSAPVTGAA